MKMSFCQMITIVCILAVGFISVGPFFLQAAYGGADQYDYDAYKLYSFATGKFIGYEIVRGGVTHTDHYNYYHYPGSSTAAWEHRRTWPGGHDVNINMHILGKKWIAD